MQSEHKTQIYLSGEQYRALKRRARAEGRPMAAVVRAAVDKYLDMPAGAGAWRHDSLSRIVGIAEGNPKDSETIDDVLYDADP